LCAGSSHEPAPKPEPPETDHDVPLIPGCPECDYRLRWRSALELWYCKDCSNRRESCSWRPHKKIGSSSCYPEPEPPEDAPDTAIAACPDCDAPDLKWRNGGWWYCRFCCERFDSATWRLRYTGCSGTADEGGLTSHDLKEMDPEDIGLPPLEVDQ